MKHFSMVFLYKLYKNSEEKLARFVPKEHHQLVIRLTSLFAVVISTKALVHSLAQNNILDFNMKIRN